MADEAARFALLQAHLERLSRPKRRRILSDQERTRRQRLDRTLYRLLQQMRCARIRAGWSQQDIAKELRTTRSAISRLESGLSSRPTLTTIENYALVLGYQVEVRLVPFSEPVLSRPSGIRYLF